MVRLRPRCLLALNRDRGKVDRPVCPLLQRVKEVVLQQVTDMVPPAGP